MKIRLTPANEKTKSIYLGVNFLEENGLIPKEVYPFEINGLPDAEAAGTLQKNGLIGGLTPLYKTLGAKAGDEVEVAVRDGAVHVKLLTAASAPSPTAPPSPSPTIEAVFEKQKLRHLHFDACSKTDFSGWRPQGEPDVYLAFGAIQEFTDYRYCCAAAKALLDRLGYTYQGDKPDAILIDRQSLEYRMGEFKMQSSAFKTNHNPDDVDVLICWEDDEKDRTKVPPVVLSLRQTIADLLAEGAFAS